MTQGSTTTYQNQNVTGTVPGGAWALANSGGASTSVGSLSFGFTMPSQVTWTNAISLSTGPLIDRTQPLTIMWSGGDANGYVDIQGSGQIGTGSGTNFNATYTYYFDCASPTSTSKFIIPPSVLLGMPTGTNAFASIQVSTNSLPYGGVSVAGFDAFANTSGFQLSAPLAFK